MSLAVNLFNILTAIRAKLNFSLTSLFLIHFKTHRTYSMPFRLMSSIQSPLSQNIITKLVNKPIFFERPEN